MLPDLFLIILVALYATTTIFDIVESIRAQRKQSRGHIYTSGDPDEQITMRSMSTFQRQNSSANSGWADQRFSLSGQQSGASFRIPHVPRVKGETLVRFGDSTDVAAHGQGLGSLPSDPVPSVSPMLGGPKSRPAEQRGDSRLWDHLVITCTSGNKIHPEGREQRPNGGDITALGRSVQRAPPSQPVAEGCVDPGISGGVRLKIETGGGIGRESSIYQNGIEGKTAAASPPRYSPFITKGNEKSKKRLRVSPQQRPLGEGEEHYGGADGAEWDEHSGDDSDRDHQAMVAELVEETRKSKFGAGEGEDGKLAALEALKE